MSVKIFCIAYCAFIWNANGSMSLHVHGYMDRKDIEAIQHTANTACMHAVPRAFNRFQVEIFKVKS